MKRLYILRHAKSSWADPGGTDFSRKLNDRGIADIAKIANAIEKKNWFPDHVYCSAANRTRLTIDLIVERLPQFSAPITYLDQLYSGSIESYQDALRNHDDSANSLMLVGHNPTCESLAIYLAKNGETDAIRTLSYKFPTGAIAVIDLEIITWREIDEDCGYLAEFSIPRELK